MIKDSIYYIEKKKEKIRFEWRERESLESFFPPSSLIKWSVGESEESVKCLSRPWCTRFTLGGQVELLGGGGGPFHETRETIHGGASAPFKILVKFQKWRPPLSRNSPSFRSGQVSWNRRVYHPPLLDTVLTSPPFRYLLTAYSFTSPTNGLVIDRAA